MAISNPNRRCVCGFTRFRESRQSVEQQVGRWMLFDTTALGGFGSTPLGTFFGAGTGGTWGKFTGTFRATTLVTTCEVCSRVRTQKRLGGVTPFGTFVEENRVIVVVSDALRPITCYSLRATAPDGEVIEVPLSLLPGMPPPIAAPTPTETAATPPPGEPLVDTMLVAALPELPVSGSYLLTLVDRCCGCETDLATVTLEAPPMIFSPLDADIGGAPTRWLHGSRLTLDAGQPAGSGRLSIPFDKCRVVIEYDSREGALPDATGWTRLGTGPSSNWALVEGGALRLQTTSPNTNYYEKAITITPVPTQIYAYASMLSEDIPAGGIGTGLDVTALYGASGSPYDGVRFNMRDNQFWYTDLGGASETQIFFAGIAPEWATAGAADRQANEEVGYETCALEHASVLLSGAFNTTGVAGANEMRVRFGNKEGAPSLLGFFRDVVAADARFIRARFTAFTQVSAPRLRLYVAADANGSALKTARFLVKYGVGTGNPYGPLAGSTGATVNMIAANSIYEVVLDMPGLTANQPFWFSIERDWAHGDDKLAATVHLFQATVRTQ